ncbi:MAG: hypothetical protein OHK0039_08350 [Bacteroidia bacterium]
MCVCRRVLRAGRGSLALIPLLFALSSASLLSAQVTADFTATVQQGCSPLTVQFFPQTTGPVVSYFWDFGNGNTSALPSPGVIYVTPGNYTISLTVSDGSNTDTEVKTAFVVVFQDPAADFAVSDSAGCAPFAVSFTDLSTPGDAPVTSWLWDFGTGVVSTVPNPAHPYVSPGTYDVTLVVTDANGCSDTRIYPDLIDVSVPPVASFTWTGPATCQLPYPVSFSSSVVPTGSYSMLWDFGDGTTATLAQPTHTYTNPGTYTVSLVATDANGCADTFRIVDAIQLQYPVAAFEAGDTVVCTGESLLFTNLSSGAVSYFWDFGDGTIFTGPSPSHAYAAPGTYTVRLIAANALGCRDTLLRQAYVEVLPGPQSAFTSSDATDCQLPYPVNFADASSGATAWLWDFGDGGTAAVPNPTHVYTAPGFYTVRLMTTAANGCRDTLVQPAYVQLVRPVADFAPDQLEGCIPLTVDFLDLSFSPFDSITAWVWDFGDGQVSFLANPSHTYTTVGQYTVQLIVQTAGGCRDTTRFSFIEAGTKPTVQFTANPLIVCAEDPVDFIDQTAVGTEWLWYFGDGETSQLQYPTHYYTDTGTFDVTFIVSYYGCRDTLLRPDFVTVLAPLAEFFMSPQVGCEVPLAVQFTDASTAPTRWHWDFGDGSSDSTQYPSHTYTGLGSYTITLTVHNDSTGCSDVATRTLDIFPPGADFVVDIANGCTGLPVTFTNLSTNATGFLWDFGDGATSTAAQPVHSYSSPGLFDVRLIATGAGGCADTLLRPALINVFGPDARFGVSQTTGCAPLTVAFTDSSITVPAGNVLTGWFWDFGDGTTATGPSPVHTYTQPGSYTVRLVVIDDQGCSDTLVRSGLIRPTFPAAAFTAVDTLVCPGAPVVFVNQSTGVGNTYLWDFGDGTTATVANPFHVYPPNVGTYTVSLTATDINGCVSSTLVSDFVAIGPPVAAFFAAPTQQACPPLNVSFTNQSSPNAVSWLWDFGDGSTSTLPNPSKVYGMPGQYDVQLIVATAQGCTDTLLLPGLIDLSGPQGSFSFTPLAGCSPLAVSFFSSTVGAVSWTWDFGDGSLGFGPTATHTYTQDTIAFPVLVIQDTAGCTVAIAADDSVVVRGGPTPGVNVGQTTTCVGQAIPFNDASFSTVPIIAYAWDFGDGNTAQGPNPFHNYSNAGSYQVQLTLTNVNGCVDSLPVPVTITVGNPPTAGMTPSQLQGCAPLTVSFGGNGGGAPVSGWWWDFGDGTTSAQQSPQHTFTTPGTYQVKLRVSNALGCLDSVVQNITVFGAPVVDFTVSNTEGCAPMTILFTDLSVGPASINSWFWDFGDGATSAQQFPTHTYLSDGDYDVRLTIGDANNCTATLLAPDLIRLSRPTALFSANTTVACPPQTVNFASLATGDTSIVQWLWDFGDGTTGSGPNPAHLYTQPGNYDVTLVIADARGCRDTLLSPAAITMRTPPSASFVLTDSIFCIPATVAFSSTSTAGSTPIVSYLWSLGNGNSASGSSVSQAYTQAGSYTVSLVATDLAGCRDTATRVLTALPPITAAFSATDSVGCSSVSLTFLDLSSGAMAWWWDFGDGSTSTQQYPQHTYGAGGTYTVTLAVADANGCTDTLARPAFIDLRSPLAAFTPDSARACPGASLSFADASLSDTSLVAWLWDFGDGTTSTQPSPTHVFAQPGLYSISLTVTDARGCSHTLTKPDAVEIVARPQAAFAASPLSGCVPLQVQFSNTSQPGTTNLTGFQWSFGNGNTFGFPNASQTYTAAGVYAVQLVVSDALGCTDTTVQTVTARGLPVAAFAASQTAGCAPQTIDFLSQAAGPAPVVGWLWDFGDGTTSTLPFPSHTYGGNGAYDVQLTVTDAFGCRDSLLRPQYVSLADPVAAIGVGNTGVCTGAILAFFDQSMADTAIVSWAWDFGDGQGAALAHPNHSYAAPGTYTVSLTIADARGCTATASTSVQVFAPPVAGIALSDSSGCAPLAVQLTDASTPGSAAITSWLWSTGTGTTSSLPVFSHLYPTPGTYTLRLIVSDVNGCRDTAGRSLVVLAPPQAAFLPGTSPACTGEALAFQQLSTGLAPLTTWLWSFGDGTVSNLQQPVHSYAASGSYDVGLVVYDVNGCTDSVLMPAAVRVTAPLAQFAVNNSPGCPGTTVSFADLSTGDTTLAAWTWYFGEGSTSSLPQPVHTYHQPGFYTVSLRVEDVLGCRDSVAIPQVVEIYTPPVAAMQAPAAGCAPLVFQAQDASSGPAPLVQWAWYLDGQLNAGGAQADFLLGDARSYSLDLLVTDSRGCRDTIRRTITVHPLPVVDFAASDTVGCSPQVLLFTDRSSSGVQWHWTFGDGGTSTVQNPVYTYAQDGLYDVQLVVTDANGCRDSLLRPQYIDLGRPEGDFTVSYVPDCPPVLATFVAAGSSPYGIASYLWDFGDGSQRVEGMSVQHTYTDTGRYAVTLIIRDSLGCERRIARADEVEIFGVELPGPVAIHAVSVESDVSVRIVWAPDASPDFAAYLVYRQDTAGGAWTLVYETAARTDTLFVDTDAAALDTRRQSYCYKVVSRNYCGTVGNLNAARTHCTIETQAQPIPDRIVVSWNNYTGWDQVSQYEVYRVLSYNPATATFLALVPGYVTSYIDSATSCFNGYTYRVQALGQGPLELSRSDTTYAENLKSEPSVATDLVRATVEQDRYVRVEWLPFVMQDLDAVFVERSEDNGQTWGTMATLPPGATAWVDSAVRVHEQSYTYRLQGRDSCGFASPYSNVGRSILLEAEASDFKSYLRWTPYGDWENGVDLYEIQFQVEATGEWIRLDYVSGSLTEYVDRSTQVDQTAYCYRIVAHERGGRRAESLSNTACVPVQPTLHVPNAFSPNGDNVNDRFFAQGVYIRQFRMKIYNRWGQEVFAADDLYAAWDGTFGGSAVPEGVYVYVISAVTNTGRRLSQEGTVTLIR